MRRVLCAVVLVAAAAGAVRTESASSAGPIQAGAVIADRIPRLARWLKAVDRHDPGERDEATDEVAEWTNAELRVLWVDINVLAQMKRNVKLKRFIFKTEAQARATEVHYTDLQLRQLATLACAAGGMVSSNPDCLAIKAGTALDGDLVKVAAHAAAERARSGDDNYVMHRAALLHADVAMLQPQGRVEPFSTTPTIGPQTWRIELSDGRSVDLGLSAVHWDIGRLAVDQLVPAPARDAMARAWYHATAAWMQFHEDHDALHLDRARQLFPDDADLLFLSGCLRETFASGAIQAAARSVVLPTGLTVGVGSDRAELRQAEGFFRRALTLRPEMGEAHLRLGRVLAELGRHADAAAELGQALALVKGDELRYYAELFAGAEEEALGRSGAARDAYARAAALFPLAQSPLLATSELATRRGDRAAAQAAIRKVFELRAALDRGRDDPWWRYHVAQARNVDELLDAVRAPFRREPVQ